METRNRMAEICAKNLIAGVTGQSPVEVRRRLYRELRMSRIAPWELKEHIERGDDLLVIDLRNPVEQDQGIIPGACLLTLPELMLSSGLRERSEVVLYCS